ncbi:MAG: hypothetical protein ACPL06_02775 [Candidatus Anstonellales archaeon]
MVGTRAVTPPNTRILRTTHVQGYLVPVVFNITTLQRAFEIAKQMSEGEGFPGAKPTLSHVLNEKKARGAGGTEYVKGAFFCGQFENDEAVSFFVNIIKQIEQGALSKEDVLYAILLNEQRLNTIVALAMGVRVFDPQLRPFASDYEIRRFINAYATSPDKLRAEIYSKIDAHITSPKKPLLKKQEYKYYANMLFEFMDFLYDRSQGF